jgi:site-specific DNA-cytosine methylase
MNMSTAKTETECSLPVGLRRLTPTECERLQGFPDGWTDILPTTPDGPRYKAIGNSMAVPVMRWIGSRIQTCR